MYKQGDTENVLNCGAVTDPSLAGFSPEFYIIVDYSQIELFSKQSNQLSFQFNLVSRGYCLVFSV